jgi:hypothetical protein
VGSGGRTAMAGPVYHDDPNLDSERRLPEYYDNTLFIYEWSRGWIKEVKLDSAGNILKINPFLDGFEFLRPMDMETGPDGALYVLEWGSSFGGGNSDSRLIRLEYKSGSPPVGVRARTPAGRVSSFSLAQNYPNPFNPTTTISYELPVAREVELSVYNLHGRKVATLVSEQQPAGRYQVEWDAAAFAGGIYFCSLKSNANFVQTIKLVLLK